MTEAPRRRRVLVVDDNVDAAETLGDLLDYWGFAVQIAFSGTVALEVAARETPDAVILDLAMPGMDGWECARRLRGHPELRRTRLIALTGFGGEDSRRRSREAGFDEHLVKPPDPEQLVRVLHPPTGTGG